METPSQALESTLVTSDSADERPKRSKKEEPEVKAAEATPQSAQNNSNSVNSVKPQPKPLGEPLNVEISVRTLLEAGVHFGHQTSRWNPAMAPYIYTIRNGIHIISLPRTVQSWARARQAIVDLVANGGAVLFVGTKKQAQDAVAQEASRCGAFYVSKRWLGGMLTNFGTVRRSVERMKKLEEILDQENQAIATGAPTKFTKKERLMYSRELEKLNLSIGGIREMTGLPQMLFVVDVKREDIAIKEAQRLDIPVVALVDTNCDPNGIDYPIPSNDDGSRAIRIFSQAVADAVLIGKKQYEENVRTGKIVIAKPQPAAPASEKKERPDGNRGPGRGGKRSDNRGAASSKTQEAAAPAAEAPAASDSAEASTPATESE